MKMKTVKQYLDSLHIDNFNIETLYNAMVQTYKDEGDATIILSADKTDEFVRYCLSHPVENQRDVILEYDEEEYYPYVISLINLLDEALFFVKNSYNSKRNEYVTLECDNAFIDIDVDSDILESSYIKNTSMFEIK